MMIYRYYTLTHVVTHMLQLSVTYLTWGDNEWTV